MDVCDPPDIYSDDAGSSLLSDTMSDLFCDPCQEEGNHIQAEGYCVDCTHHLCGSCFLYHRRPKPWRHHQLLDKQLMPKSKADKVYKDECTDKCATHGEEILRYFCDDHRIVGCTICITLGHRSCKVEYIPTLSMDFFDSKEYKAFKCKVEYIPTLSMDFFDSKEYKAFKSDIESLARTTRTLQEAATRNFEYICQHAERAKDKIMQLRKKINTFFDDLEQIFLDKVSKIKNEDQDKIEALSKQSEALAGMIEGLEADIKDKESKNQKCRLFVDVKELQDTLEKYKNDISTMEKTNTVRDVTFKPSETICNLISDQSVEFGSLVDFCQTASSFAILSGDMESNVTDIAVLPGGKVAVIDAKNDCMKVIDTTRDRLITSLALPEDSGYSNRITTVSDNDIALLYDGEIKLYSITDPFKLTKTIRTSLSHWGFVYTNNSFIGFTKPLQPTLCMVNMNGDVVKTFPTQIDGVDIFNHPRCIAVNSDQTTIYVSDWRSDIVTCLTIDDEVNSRYKYSSQWIRGIVVSREGLVYVCDAHGDKIHILTSDLEEVGQIDGEKYDMRHPWGIGYCSKEHKLYVVMKDSQLRAFNI